ncbi:MAG: class I SAM-dependent methyltransferase [Gemmatimonadota bacterium]|nr:MAG: class I SAM-dependent methyltransferase [Gemmatimonadota bacterium]
MRKKSTLALGMIINKIVSNMRDGECFLNIGVWKGYTLFAGMVGNESKVCIGVDNFSQFGSPRGYFLEKFRKLKSENHYFFEMSYEKYFEQVHRSNIGFYIYDGHHGYENQLNNLLVAEQFFSDGCIVMIDDTNFSQVRKATQDFIATSKNTYEILVDARTPRDRHMTFWNGVMIFQKTG